MKKIFTLLIALCLSAGVWAYDFEKDGIYYSIRSNSKELYVDDNDEDKYKGEIVIPESVDYNGVTYSVTYVLSAFRDCPDLISVTMPNTISGVDGSFLGCPNLKKVVLGSGISAVYDTFKDCPALTTIVCPAIEPPLLWLTHYSISVDTLHVPNESISRYSSQMNTGPTQWWDISKTIENLIYTGHVFEDENSICYRITSTNPFEVEVVKNINHIHANKISIPLNGEFEGEIFTVVGIAGNAFSNSEITEIEIPNSISNIGDNAFAGCTSLKRVTCLSESPIQLGTNVFNNVPLSVATLVVPQDLFAYYKFNAPWSEFRIIENLIQVGHIFTGEQALKYRITSKEPFEVEIIENVNSAYSGGINIPSKGIFEDEEFTTIGIAENVFKNSDITEIEIPSTITSIGDNAFAECTKLTKVKYMAASPPTLGNDVFLNASIAQATLIVPEELFAYYQYTNPWKGFGNFSSTGEVTNIYIPTATPPFTQQGNTLVFTKDTNIAIYSLSGACIYKGTTQNYTLPNAGIYIVSTKEGNYKVLNK